MMTAAAAVAAAAAAAVVMLVAILCCATSLSTAQSAGAVAAAPKITPFVRGDVVDVECRVAERGTNTSWVPAFTCHETGAPLAFRYGIDEFKTCGWEHASAATYAMSRNVVEQRVGWQCRVPMSADRTYHVPLNIALWGVTEPAHFHMNFHYNFVFHIEHGRVLGASVYPVRDMFTLVKPSTLVSMHGTVAWFHRNTFTPPDAAAVARPTLQRAAAKKSKQQQQLGIAVARWMPSDATWALVAWSALSAAATTLLLSSHYYRTRKPALIKSLLKKD